MKKRIFAILMALLVMQGLVACKDDGTAEESTDSESEPPRPEVSFDDMELSQISTESEAESLPSPGADRSIDIYLIAGQSNAVGHSKIKDLEGMAQLAPSLLTGYSNIFYAGNARTDSVSNNLRTIIDHDRAWQKVTMGLGRVGSYIGPEAGMAEALSSYYNETTGKQAGIIKFAHGGTSLLNKVSGSNQFGNWVPPTYAQMLSLSYDDGDVTGQLYRDLLSEVESNLRVLKARGYEQINIKALYWMQGENDRGAIAEYEIAFGCLVEDLRRDLSAMMRELNGSEEDGGASEMAIFVGTISEAYALSEGDKTGSVFNVPFITMQRSLPSKFENCYVVDNSQYAINRWDFETDKNVVLGADQYHWNQQDMLSIGYDAGRAILRNCLSDWDAVNDELWSSMTVTDPNGEGWSDPT